jgi:DNA-binding IclR family transcriptional regulator
MREPESSSNAERAAIVLLALGDVGLDGIALKDLAAKLGDSKASLHRTLVALMRHGFIEQVTGSRNYRLGSAVYALSRRQSTASEKVRRWRPVLMELGERLSCTIFLMERVGMNGVVLDTHIGSIPVPILAEGPGRHVPLGYGPGSVAILSHQEPEEREAILAANEAEFRSRGVDPAMVRFRVEEAAASGFARSVGDIFAGYGGVAVPIGNRNGSADTAITASTLAQRLTDSVIFEIAATLKSTVEAAQHEPSFAQLEGP